MWTEAGWRVVRNGAVVAALALLVGCGGDAPEPEAEREMGVAAGDAPGAVVEPSGPVVATVADLFPEDPAKQMVLSNCTSCHAVACSVIGQRPEARWMDLEAAHREHVPSLSDAEREQIFAYLAANFNDTRPEPNVPPEMIQAGCTPF